MATIDLITYDQKMVTPKDDALIHQFGISNGVLYGCEITLANSNTLHITGGQGVIYGRQWEIAEGDITVTLPASGSLKGRLYVKIDLSNTTNPIELLVQTAVTLPDLTDDDQINVDNSVSELELCTFDVSSLTISNLERTVEQVADGDHQDVVDLQADVSEIKSNLTDKMYRKEVDAIGPVSAGGTIDLNNYITDWADSFKVEFYLRRYGRVGFVSIPTNLALTDVASDVNYMYQGNIRTCGFNSSGVFTVSGSQTDPVFIDIIAYYGANQQPS